LGAVPSLPPSDVRACLVNGTYQKLADFPSLDQLGCALVSPYHNNVHGNIGPTDNSGNLLGDMGSPVLAPQDPIFWRWHAFLSQIAFTEWLGSLDPDKQAMAACKLPPPLYGACDQASLTYEYDADIPDKYQTYTGKPPKVPANYLYVNGKPATDVSYQSGGTYSTYTYSGYLDQPTGPVTVTIKDNKYTYDSGGGKGTYYVRGDTYTYDNFDCPGGCLDSDGDGVYDAPCWPNPGYDNCPYDYNPDQYDTDAFYTSHDSYGDACQLWTCGNGVQEPGEQCDDGNGASGDGCRSDCQSDESCPNGQVDIGEICDDGNFDDNDGCKNDCTGNGCGDGYPDYSSYYSDTYYFGQPYYGSQPCDDGNLTYGDGCSGDCCPETGYSDRYNTVVGFDCHLRVIDQTLRYSRYDLKIIRKFQAQQRKIRQKFEGKIRYDEYDEPCAAAVKLAPKTKKLALLAEKYTALGKIPSGPGSKLIARAQAYRDYAQSVALIHRTGGGACNP
jgi:cysteine-rich repeat protein